MRRALGCLFFVMHTFVSSFGRLTWAALCVVGVVWGAGCAHVTPLQPMTPAPVGSALAQVKMVNGSGCAWRIVFTAQEGGARQAWMLGIAKSIEAHLPEGNYTVEQTMVAAEVEKEQVRRFPMRLVAGQTYGWRLLTLLSGSAGEVRLPVSANNGHE